MCSTIRETSRQSALVKLQKSDARCQAAPKDFRLIAKYL
jgi:hypothetical protein